MSSGLWRFECFLLPHFSTKQIDGLDQVKDVNYFYIGIRHQQSPVSTALETRWVVGSWLLNQTCQQVSTFMLYLTYRLLVVAVLLFVPFLQSSDRLFSNKTQRK